MSTGNIEFDAGNEFAAPPAAAPAAPVAAPATEPAPAPAEAPDAPATWTDTPTAETDTPTTEAAPAAAPTAASVEIKGAKGVHKFDLTPDNAELMQTLKLGLGARKWQQERDAARAELAKVKPEYETATKQAKVWGELETLTKRGHHDQVVRAVLGDDAYEKFVKQIVTETVGYENAAPDERAQIDRTRMQRGQDLKDFQAQRKLEELQTKLDAQESRVETDRLRSLGTSALQRHDFRGFVEDADLANALNQKLWALAWTDLESVADAQEITPELVQKTFAANAKVLRAGQERIAQARVGKVLEQKKQAATRTAQAAATERYPTQGPDLSTWDGRRSKDLLKMLVRGGR